MKFKREKYDTFSFFSFSFLKWEFRLSYYGKAQTGYLGDFQHKIIHEIKFFITKKIN